VHGLYISTDVGLKHYHFWIPLSIISDMAVRHKQCELLIHHSIRGGGQRGEPCTVTTRLRTTKDWKNGVSTYDIDHHCYVETNQFDQFVFFRFRSLFTTEHLSRWILILSAIQSTQESYSSILRNKRNMIWVSILQRRLVGIKLGLALEPRGDILKL